MSRVSTLNTYEAALGDLQRAQQRQMKAQTQLSSEKRATDLKGYGRESETLAAFRSMQARLQGFVETGESVAARLETQDLALGRTADAIQRARQSIAEALATGRGDTLMVELQGTFLETVEGLSAKHQGRYLFSGASVDTRPVGIDTLSELALLPAAGDAFRNDALKAVSRLDEATSVETGMLADELGTAALDAFRDVQIFHQGAPFSGPLTDAQRVFLEGMLAEFDAAHGSVLEFNARNGSLQNRVDANLVSHQAQADSLQDLIGEKSGVNMAEAITRLQQAQISVQATAQVLASLRDVSLLNYLD